MAVCFQGILYVINDSGHGQWHSMVFYFQHAVWRFYPLNISDRIFDLTKKIGFIWLEVPSKKHMDWIR